MLASLALTAVLTTAAVAAPSIPELAVSSGRLKTLVAAVQAADLLETLGSEGPFTVFAPTDSAFSKIDESTLNSLLEEPGRGTLRRILTHHVVAGRLDAASLLSKDEIETLAGTTLPLDTFRDRLLVGDAVVETANLEASNGMVHLIDRVLLPPAPESPLRAFLERAIERGVPLFNDGTPEACAAVYATALDAVVSSEGWGVTAQQLPNLQKSIRDAASIGDAAERAWAYRRIIDSLWRGMPQGQQARLDDGNVRSIFNFEDPSTVRRWNIVLDGVMGGLSTGRIAAGENTLQFTGSTSLRNNGGFSSMRASIPAGSLNGYDAIRLRVKGDGRNWIVGTRKSTTMGADSFWTRFDTTEGEWIDVMVPISDMERHFFGERLPGDIRPDQVRGLEFYIYDKKAGPFSLEIDRIDAVRSSSS
ncbi:MAG: CIA30 family protein [Phycisphaerales bacterium]|nr:CIA30 family protein [Phycisphaerales bacterium]